MPFEISNSNDELIFFNASELEKLILSLLNGTCIFFGAGISKLAGFKSWYELKNSMVEYFWQNRDKLDDKKKINFDYSFCESLKNYNKYYETFDTLYYLNKDLFNCGMENIFYSDFEKINNKVYYFLNKLNNGKNFFITTNIDMGFQKYLGLAEESISIYPEFSESPKLITYLHGRLDKKDSWIFTSSQYNEAYNMGMAPCKKFLENIFKNYNVLFIGYGLNENDIKRIFFSTKKSKTHYWLEGLSRNNKNDLIIRSISLQENYNIQLIPYDIDQKGYEALYDIIDLLYKEMNKIKRTLK